MAIAIERLRHQGLIEGALILDIDLHFGDGTHNFFSRHSGGGSSHQYFEQPPGPVSF